MSSIREIQKKPLTIGDYSLDSNDIYIVFDSILDEKGLIDHHLTSANDLYEIGIPQIISQVFSINMRLDDIKRHTEEEKNIDHLLVNITFSNVVINKPSTLSYHSGKEEILFPNEALLKEKTYKSTLSVDVHIKITAMLKTGHMSIREDTVRGFKICKIPIMVKSRWCNTYGLTREALTRLHEDPSDPGGYFIINGVEWVIDCVENILFNKVRIFKNEGYKKEIMRAEFISKPGDFYLNSDQFIVRWLNDGQITIEIRREKLKDIYIPFYLIFRIMGWNTDRQILENILLGESPTSKNMSQYLIDAFNAKYSNLSKGRYIYSQGEVLQYFAEEIKDEQFAYLDIDNHPENYQRITNFLLEHLDIHFLQHMGTTMNDREKKLRFLCNIIRKMFLVKLGNMEPTDRDSYNSKRIHAAGTSYAKSFKTHFNAAVIQQIKRKLTKDFKSFSFFQIDLAASIKQSVYGAEFERAITQAITAGNKSQITVSKRVRINRLSSQLLNRKNQLNVYSILRQVTATSSDSAKQSERASEMRRVHMSFLGYICVTHSPEGEKVGINKQLALFSFVTRAAVSAVIKDMLLNDTEIYPLEKTDHKLITEKQLCNVYVNGDWIGCCEDALKIAKKYRQLRRQLAISPEISIVWDNTQDEVYFWADVGRVIRPLLIVYNNKRDPEMFPRKSGFKQGLALRADHIEKLYARKITFEDLLREGVVEFISAEEQENMYLASSYETLKQHQDNELYEYTHCDLPQAILGVTALTSPYAQHNQAQRIVYQTSQSKQTCGMFAKNWPFRSDKDTFLQYRNEMPLVKTASNRYLYPNGSNCIVAIMCNTGYNVEDSIIMSKGAIERGLFDGCKFTFYKTELEQREEFANPDIATTMDIKSACYDKVVNGIVKKGTIINKNDVIIGKVIKLTGKSPDDVFQYADRSVVYRDEEPAVVHNVIVDRNEEDERFCKVVLRKIRPSHIGDKYCFTPGHEVLTNRGWKLLEKITTDDIVATLNERHEVEWHHPSATHVFDHEGDVYILLNDDVALVSTLNHKMYYKMNNEYKLSEVYNIMGRKTNYKKNGVNLRKNNRYFHLPNSDIIFDMNPWLVFLGIYLIEGSIVYENIGILTIEKKISRILDRVLPLLGINYIANDYCYIIENTHIKNYLYNLEKNNDRCIPSWALSLSKEQSRILLNALTLNGLYTNSKSLADDIQVLAFNAEMVASITKNVCYYSIKLSDHPKDLEPCVRNNDARIEQYKGFVYCLTVPNNIFMVRYDGKHCWTGNSARSGQKATVGLLLRDEDMPSTEDGIRPSIIMNPHGFPSRMTIGQLYESMVSNLCAEKCAHIDATMFRKIDIESVASELESLGLNRYGYKRLYNGITGEYIDAEIFMGPTYYQRLQKFAIDTLYSVSSGASDILTNQPIDGGKSSQGGLRIGEMERDVITSHGASKFLTEKFFNHSDGYVQYYCRCGKQAVVNPKKNIYKCNYCKDNAEIVAYPTSWSAKLFRHELESMNVGLRIKPEPYTYEKEDSKIFEIIEE